MLPAAGDLPLQHQRARRELAVQLHPGEQHVALLHGQGLGGVIQEMLVATTSEREGRAIDKDQSASMEKKKREGYF